MYMMVLWIYVPQNPKIVGSEVIVDLPKAARLDNAGWIGFWISLFLVGRRCLSTRMADTCHRFPPSLPHLGFEFLVGW